MKMYKKGENCLLWNNAELSPVLKLLKQSNQPTLFAIDALMKKATSASLNF